MKTLLITIIMVAVVSAGNVGLKGYYLGNVLDTAKTLNVDEHTSITGVKTIGGIAGDMIIMRTTENEIASISFTFANELYDHELKLIIDGLEDALGVEPKPIFSDGMTYFFFDVGNGKIAFISLVVQTSYTGAPNKDVMIIFKDDELYTKQKAQKQSEVNSDF